MKTSKGMHPARIFATVNGEVASYPAGTRCLIGGWSERSESSRAAEFVRGDVRDELVAALKAYVAADGMTGDASVTMRKYDRAMEAARTKALAALRKAEGAE